jgi:hypothetical protein
MRKLIKSKKGFELGGLYQFVLMLVLIGMILGVGVLILDKFAATSSITSTAATAINDTRDAITPIATTWLPLIVTIVVLAIILTIVIRSFAQTGGGRR